MKNRAFFGKKSKSVQGKYRRAAAEQYCAEMAVAYDHHNRGRADVVAATICVVRRQTRMQCRSTAAELRWKSGGRQSRRLRCFHDSITFRDFLIFMIRCCTALWQPQRSAVGRFRWQFSIPCIFDCFEHFRCFLSFRHFLMFFLVRDSSSDNIEQFFYVRVLLVILESLMSKMRKRLVLILVEILLENL